MITKEFLIESVREMNRDKPEGWREKIKEYLRMLREMEDPFRDLEYRGGESTGRRYTAPNKAPRHDDYSERSAP